MTNREMPDTNQPSERIFTVEELQSYRERIVAAIQSAPLEEEADTAILGADQTDAAYIKGEQGKEAIEKRTQSFVNSVEFPDVETFVATFASNEILRKFLSPDEIKEIVEHEKEHIAAAQKHGYTTKMGVEIVKTKDGRLRFTPFVTVSVELEGVDENEVRSHLKDIAGAPEHLSDSDKRKV